MKRCLTCQNTFPSNQQVCPLCGSSPEIIDDFEAYAPHLAHGGGGFKASYFSDLATLESANFWFKVRNEVILWALTKYFPQFAQLMEIGCGTGFVLSGIARTFPHARLCGSEVFSAGLKFASDRLPSAQFMQVDARSLPFFEEFDVIGAFDVIEHIDRDDLVLEQVFAALKFGGIVVITVPQHPWLWSQADEFACHQRRYARGEMERKLHAAGFKLLRSTSFVTTLLPVMLASRMLQKRRTDKFDPMAEFKIGRALNTAFGLLLKLELSGIKRGLNYPMGGSRLLVASKGKSR